MSTHNTTIKAYEEKITAQLQQAKAQLAELEARAKGKVAQAESNLIHDLKTRHREIDKKLHELKTIGDANAEQVKAEIDAHVDKLKSSLTELASKLKEHAKAS